MFEKKHCKMALLDGPIQLNMMLYILILSIVSNYSRMTDFLCWYPTAHSWGHFNYSPCSSNQWLEIRFRLCRDSPWGHQLTEGMEINGQIAGSFIAVICAGNLY